MAKGMAVGFLRQAERRQKSAKAALEESDFAYVVRQCQEGVELALKAVLIYAGIDFPKWHDVGPILIREKDSLKFWNDEVIQKLRKGRKVSLIPNLSAFQCLLFTLEG